MRRNLLARAAAFALLFHAPAAFAQAAAPAPAAAAATQDADPALWVVKDKDTTIYLFGTVHLLKPGLSWFDEAVRQAFDASGELVTELGSTPDLATVQPAMMKYGIAMSGPPLSEKLPADKRAAFLKAMADAGVPQAVADRFDPWLAGTQLSMLTLIRAGYAPDSGVEAALDAAAKAAKKPVSGLETVDQQFGYFDALPEAAQMKLLTDAIDKMDEAPGEFAKLISAWASGDAERLGTLMNEGLRESPELAKVLLADRNARWADWIKARLAKPGTVFVAVGAGHLAGRDSVQAMLKARKVKTKRVKY
ncbi:TraB/GumN family protein [Sphingomonas turrisvirgatae]|uniref:Polysaccharide biosynthesis protein GumN n=1 Tax=Sphingomonas turrisvirgatae TaxID=1888892 RepID=A0A1E3M2D3_9SPHN|nr:TraB/GumN family protein [Sphingomonas turrisvirgatae]ODP39525.1 polysaccharide biosynthesis protein GumN [Sphingomonas turrisvirgatae]